jgi:hypothetical protein
VIAGMHDLLPQLLQLLHGSGHANKDEVQRIQDFHEQLRSMMGHGVPIADAFTPGTQGYEVGNESTKAVFPAMLLGRLKQHTRPSEYEQLHDPLSHAQETGDLRSLLQAHRRAGRVFAAGGSLGSAPYIWYHLWPAIRAGQNTRIDYANMLHEQHQRDHRPMLPEDYYSL